MVHVAAPVPVSLLLMSLQGVSGGINKPLGEWLCDYCSMGRSSVTGANLLSQCHCVRAPGGGGRVRDTHPLHVLRAALLHHLPDHLLHGQGNERIITTGEWWPDLSSAELCSTNDWVTRLVWSVRVFKLKINKSSKMFQRYLYTPRNRTLLISMICNKMIMNCNIKNAVNIIIN